MSGAEGRRGLGGDGGLVEGRRLGGGGVPGGVEGGVEGRRGSA